MTQLKMNEEGTELMLDELSTFAKEDGQSIRAFINYLISTYHQLKGHEFSFDGVEFKNYYEYLDFLRGIVQMMEHSHRQECMDDSDAFDF